MKKVSFNFKKWAVRGMVAAGALLGLSACSGGGSSCKSAECAYGPPPEVQKEIERIEDVYGPPVKDMERDTVEAVKEDTMMEIEPVEVVYGPAPN